MKNRRNINAQFAIIAVHKKVMWKNILNLFMKIKSLINVQFVITAAHINGA